MTEEVIINIVENVESVSIEETQPIARWGEIVGDIVDQSDLIDEISDPSRLAQDTPVGKYLRDDGTFQAVEAGSVEWGLITGTLSNQTDLNNALGQKASSTDLSNHVGNTSNPHSVTKTQIGLSNVPNVDVTNASNISSGTIDGDRLPSISETKKGGVPATGTPSGKYLSDSGSWESFDNSIPILDKTSGNYNLSLTDINSFHNITTATVVTIKLDNVVDIPIGSSIIFYRNTTGTVSLTKDIGVTLNSEHGLILNAQYSVAGIIKIAVNSWVCFGSLKAS